MTSLHNFIISPFTMSSTMGPKGPTYSRHLVVWLRIPTLSGVDSLLNHHPCVRFLGLGLVQTLVLNSQFLCFKLTLSFPASERTKNISHIIGWDTFIYKMYIRLTNFSVILNPSSWTWEFYYIDCGSRVMFTPIFCSKFSVLATKYSFYVGIVFISLFQIDIL